MITQRCIFVEGIGRVHALSNAQELHVAAMDVEPQDEAEAGNAAFDIVAPFVFANVRDPKIRWSVRFAEIAP